MCEPFHHKGNKKETHTDDGHIMHCSEGKKNLIEPRPRGGWTAMSEGSLTSGKCLVIGLDKECLVLQSKPCQKIKGVILYKHTHNTIAMGIMALFSHYLAQITKKRRLFCLLNCSSSYSF